MTSRRRWLMAICALLLPAAAAWPQSAPPVQRSEYLDAAVGLGEWLLDATQQGRRWVGAILPNGGLRAASTIGPESGASGIGLFWLGLHDHTGDPKWLDFAERAAEHERAQFALADHGPDYLSGAAGSGLYMLALHERSRDPRHLQWAEDYATWLDETAARPAPGERHWMHAPNFPKTYVGIPHGAAGILLFHVALFQATGKAIHLEAAQESYRWLRHHALPVGNAGAIGFKRLVADSAVYNWWSGGSAGVMHAQGLLYGVTGDAAYVDDLRRTADGLVELGDPASPRGRFWSTNGDTTPYRPIVFSHGNASIAPALLLANEYVPDADYVAAAAASMDWLQAIARPGAENQAGGLFWEHSKGSSFGDLQTTGAFVGTASIGWMLARMHALTGDERSRRMALDSADYLLGVGERLPDGKRRWISYTGPDNSGWGAKEYSLGWYDGNAGIGLFLLAAHELATGQRPRLDVHTP